MLRRRLLKVIGPMVAVLAVTAVVGVILLQETLGQLVDANGQDLTIVGQANLFLADFRDARRNLHEMAIGHSDQTVPMVDCMNKAAVLLEAIHASPIVNHPTFTQPLNHIRDNFPDLEKQIVALSRPGADTSPTHAEAIIAAMNEIDGDVGNLSQLVSDQAKADYQGLSNRLRWQVLAFSIVSILVINLSVLALLRMGAMILRPVDKLVAAARDLGQEHFDVRINLDTDDEFAQLAQAYNHMAEELQASEKRRMEVLSQVALSMSHELNNVINIIELQLVLVSKRTDCAAALEDHLKQIRQSLERMTNVVNALRHARRIVLTDYMAGMKMLDVERSAQAFDTADEAISVSTVPDSHAE